MDLVKEGDVMSPEPSWRCVWSRRTTIWMVTQTRITVSISLGSFLPCHVARDSLIAQLDQGRYRPVIFCRHLPILRPSAALRYNTVFPNRQTVP
jgi:hypothetical protein